MDKNKQYLDIVTESLKTINKDTNIQIAAKWIAQAYIKVYTFSTGHSHMLGEELYARAGG